MNLQQGIVYEDKKKNTVVDNISKKATDILIHIRSVFPFDLFPDELIIDGTKVTLINRSFIASGQVYTIPIEKILDITVEMSLLFATILLRDRRKRGEVFSIRYLKKDEALAAREIMAGFIVLQAENVNEISLPTPIPKKAIEKIGKLRL